MPSSSSSSSPVHFIISPENVLKDSKCKTCKTAESKIKEQLLSDNGSNNETEDNIDDPHWELPYREKRRLDAKAENITLTLPSRSIPSLMAATSTVTKTSTRQELKRTARMFNAGCADINEVSLSQSTIYRQRRKEVDSKADKIKKKIKMFGNEKQGKFLVFHWDGKIIQLLSGETEDRLAIAISVPNIIPGQFLASLVIPDGTGLSMAKAVFELASEYCLLSKTEAMVFDTTASNTGQWKGSVSRFEKSVGRSLLWLACRHHIPELHIKHAHEVLRGPSRGPDDPLFKRFKTIYGSIVTADQSAWIWPHDPNDWRYQRASTVLAWADHHMEVATWCREDYREILELVVIFIVRDEVVRQPGTIHRARSMASCFVPSEDISIQGTTPC